MSTRNWSSAWRLRLGHDQVLATLRDFGAGRHQVERRRLPDVHPRLVIAFELEREVQ
jgi:hypothetical protein